jgi:thiol-disulfide isomerase/thioredoxin
MYWRSISAVLVLSSACASTANVPVQVADEAPAESAAFVVTDMSGAQLDIDATLASGKTVALVFWQTWCESCIAEAPKLARAAATYSDSVQFIGVVPGPTGRVDDEEVKRVAAELGLTYPQVRDRDLALTQRFEVMGTPTIIALGDERELLYRGHRPPKDWKGLRK